MGSRHRQKGGRRSRRAARRNWTRLSDEALLDVRLCDLRLSVHSGAVAGRVARLYEELEARSLRFRPHCWLSEEWFSPDGVPGIAIPFFLAHPRLMRLERRMMLEVEGGSERWFMRLLRHEAGHAIDTAWRLHRRKQWRKLFGRYGQPYPDFYVPKPYSKRFVQHLDMWYAQSHPAEDFAETFAVWLQPRSRWRSQYAGWPALEKLAYVDQLMSGLAGRRPPVRSREHVEPLSEVRKTLGEYYAEKRARYEVGMPDVYDRELRRLFSAEPEHARRPTAAAFLRRHRDELTRIVARGTGQYQYVIDQVLGEIINRCLDLRLRVAGPEEETRRDALVMLAVQTMNYLHSGHHRLAL